MAGNVPEVRSNALPICEGQPAGAPGALSLSGRARIKHQGLRQRRRAARIEEGISLDSLFMIEGSQRARQML